MSILAAAGNVALLTPPFLLTQIMPWQDRLAGAAVLCLSLIAASETACASPLLSSGVPPSDDLAGLNWIQGTALLLSFNLALFVQLSGWLSPEGSQVWSTVGFFAICMGGMLRALAIRRLGAGFGNGSCPLSVVLCTEGIYAKLRHPAEIGLLMIAAGLPLLLGQLQIAIALLPFFLVISVLRIRQENQGLAQAFPIEFEAYCRLVR